MLKLVAILLVACLGWRLWKGQRRTARPPRAIGNKAEALALLGLDGDANDDDIRAAHRRLIAKVHPDRGGSADLARRINLARDTLLGRND
jgi:preprotein translocase subunit Sec63